MKKRRIMHGGLFYIKSLLGILLKKKGEKRTCIFGSPRNFFLYVHLYALVRKNRWKDGEGKLL